MKVILTKNCKDGKENDIIEISDGYGKNFLIKNGFALPFNSTTMKVLQKKIETNKKNEQKKIEEINKLKEKIEKITLSYNLTTKDKIVYGSITRKQILKDLNNLNIKIKSFDMESCQINNLGISEISIKLNCNIIAKLKIEVKGK